MSDSFCPEFSFSELLSLESSSVVSWWAYTWFLYVKKLVKLLLHPCRPQTILKPGTSAWLILMWVRKSEMVESDVQLHKGQTGMAVGKDCYCRSTSNFATDVQN